MMRPDDLTDERHTRLPAWASDRHRLCAQCGRLFNGQYTFDVHQTERYDRTDGGPMIECHDPRERGLVWNVRRRAWSRADNPRARFRAIEELATATRAPGESAPDTPDPVA